MPQFNLTSPLMLATDPVQPLQAATKQYVDSLVEVIDTSRFTSGVLPIERLPAFTGDLTSSAGTNVLSLSVTGVVPGTYTKVNVNAKGLVTEGFQLSTADIEEVSWDKITMDKPTTLAGYGITDGVAKTGGTVSGPLFTNSTPTADMHIVNKQFVDDVFANTSTIGLVTGDVVRKPIAAAEGFLRCNGATLNAADYTDLYTFLGDSFTKRNDFGKTGGKPWKRQNGFDTNGIGDTVGTWSSATSLPVTLYQSQAVVTKNRVYLLGGYANGAQTSAVYTAPINADGTLGTWSTSTALPTAIVRTQAIVTKNRIYLLGGQVASAQSAAVYTAAINTDGTLGAWSTATSLPSGVSSAQAITTKNRVYLIGGWATSTVYTAPISADGTLGAWTTGPSFPYAVSLAQVVATKNRLYMLGGTLNGTYGNSVYTAAINADGTLGTWTLDSPLPVNISYTQAVTTKTKVYLLGGWTGTAAISTVYVANINEDGTLGTWSTPANPLPVARYSAHVVSTKDRLYLIGGITVSNVYTATLNSGLNDYSSLYTYDPSVIPDGQFRLPDYTAQESAGIYYYIKM